MLEMSNMIENQMPTIQVDLEFLDHTFKMEVPKNIDLEELFEIIEKFIFENPSISIDLKSLSKTILDTEYYNLILKQNNSMISKFDEIQIGIPLKLELESDSVKKRYFTKKHLKSTFRHLDSISINEFSTMFHVANLSQFRQNLISIESQYPITITDDVIHLTKPLTNEQLKSFTNKILEFMD